MARAKKIEVDPMVGILNNIAKSVGYKESSPLIYRFGDVEREGIEVISFGHKEIDDASGIGGIQLGKVVEIFGLESSGKSYLTLKLIAQAQKQGLKCFLADIEQSFDPEWAAKQGVDVDNLFIMNQSICAETALDVVDGVCKSGQFGLVVIDSTAALIPQKEMEGSVGDADYALLARAMSKGMKKIKASCHIGNTACVFINQVRTTMPQNGRPGEMITPGGKSLDFYSDMRISVFPGGMLKALGESGEEVTIGKKSFVRFIKNKLGNPDKRCEIQIIFDETAMNPIVKLVTLAKAYKFFNVKLGEYGISAELIKHDSKNKYYNTKASTFGELAHWVLSNGYIEDLLDVVKEAVESEENDEKLKLIDKVIYDLIEVGEDNEFIHKDLWVSPMGDYSHPTDPDVAKGAEKDEEVASEEATKIIKGLVKSKKDATLEDNELDLE
jgi:recombination protein RecA